MTLDQLRETITHPIRDIFKPMFNWVKENPIKTLGVIALLAAAGVFTAGAAFMPIIFYSSLVAGPSLLMMAGCAWFGLDLVSGKYRENRGLNTIPRVLAAGALVLGLGLLGMFFEPVALICAGITVSIAAAAVVAGLASASKTCMTKIKNHFTANEMQPVMVSNSLVVVSRRTEINLSVPSKQKDNETSHKNDNTVEKEQKSISNSTVINTPDSSSCLPKCFRR